MATATSENSAARPTEATPLLANNIDWVRQEFEDALHEEEPDSTESFYSLLWKRPGTLIIVMALLASITLIGKLCSDVLSSPDTFARIADARLVHAEIVEIRESQIEAQIVGTLSLDYDKLGTGLVAKLSVLLAGLVGTVNVQFPGPVDVRIKTPNGEFEHAAMVYIPVQLPLNIVPNAEPALIDAQVLIEDIGREEVIGFLATSMLRGKAVDAQIRAPLQMSKWGLDYEVKVTLEQSVKAPKSQMAMTDVTKVRVNAASGGQTNGLNISADIVTHVNELPFSVGGELPALKWNIKVPGCTAKSIEVAQGVSDSICLDKQPNVTTSVWASIDKLPSPLKAGCQNDEDLKSPLDRFISRYLAGEVLEVHFSGSDNEGIISQILAGLEFPFSMDGKPRDEKLVQAVQLEKVQFSQTREVEHPTTFSGEAIVDVTLPELIDIDRKNVVAAVTGIRGTIDLLTTDGEQFGTVNLEDWSQTITLATEEGYRIKCFFHDVPFDITSAPRFAEISQQLLVYGSVDIEYETGIDADIATPIGSFLLRRVYLRGETSLSTGFSDHFGKLRNPFRDPIHHLPAL